MSSCNISFLNEAKLLLLTSIYKNHYVIDVTNEYDRLITIYKDSQWDITPLSLSQVNQFLSSSHENFAGSMFTPWCNEYYR